MTSIFEPDINLIVNTQTTSLPRNATLWNAAITKVEGLYTIPVCNMIVDTYETQKTTIEIAEMVVRGVMDSCDYLWFCFWREVSQVYNDYARSGDLPTIAEFQVMSDIR